MVSCCAAMRRGNNSSTADNEHGIHDIGTHDVTHCEVGGVLQGGDETDEELGCRGACGDNGEADDDFGHVQATGYGRGSIGEPVGTPQHQINA